MFYCIKLFKFKSFVEHNIEFNELKMFRFRYLASHADAHTHYVCFSVVSFYFFSFIPWKPPPQHSHMKSFKCSVGSGICSSRCSVNKPIGISCFSSHISIYWSHSRSKRVFALEITIHGDNADILQSWLTIRRRTCARQEQAFVGVTTEHPYANIKIHFICSVSIQLWIDMSSACNLIYLYIRSGRIHWVIGDCKIKEQTLRRDECQSLTLSKCVIIVSSRSSYDCRKFDWRHWRDWCQSDTMCNHNERISFRSSYFYFSYCMTSDNEDWLFSIGKEKK